MTILSNAAVTELKGVGAKMAERLAKVGIETIQDVLFHLPSRYEDRTRIYPISDLQPFFTR
jgi:ATP-dependent DNA helicase RecG